MIRLALFVLLLSACTPNARNLDELVQRDSTYYAPETMEPYTGPVYRAFRADTTQIEIEGVMRNGTWHGMLRVYHPNGRIRYEGELADGAPCGAWTENADAEPRESVYEQLVQDIESMGVYPPCLGER